ncbi:peptidase S8/S53 domain-containing protein [Neurospora hispaniola]|uniref:Peptidase S8/S53 domain-containing protein n=1 Tax=Neurospora hispaniola TaxID=588809 RepID=A0AAJ0I562_9PEZI|nr:peptidase S8/S53 domain-containing protein [Neurospora hispaniola]
MCTIFRWLKELHVKSVMKVTVMDEGKLSHSDEAIERCMGGLDVKIWNWRRVDLCIDVIANSAPNVTDVTLYSSGNNAVFVGWSSIGGLPKLKKLRKVRIFVKDSLETPTKLQEYQKRFKQELLGHRPDLKLYWPTQDRSVFQGSSSVKTSGEPKWIKTMKQFAEFLRSTKPKPPVTPVKIAIIDDGIDSTQKIFTERIQTGESFYAAGSRWKGAYYVPTGSHGTLMAQLICAVCPETVAKLYIAQLEPVPRSDGRRGFTPQSAIEAIEWAVSRSVDIISMSWSIDLDPGSSDINRLKSALDKARAQNIVMFCSSIDEGPVGDDNTYPGKEGSCIKIGASTGDGSRLSWVSAKSSDFLLPGDESVHFSLQENGQSISASRRAGYGSEVPPGGSSISTALAAGLAGVVMFCDRLIHSSNDGTLVGSNYFENPAAMKRAFTIMAAKSDDKNFPRVWRFIPSHWENPLPPDEANSRGCKAEKRELKWNEDAYPEDTEETKKQLMKFLNKLKSDDKDE